MHESPPILALEGVHAVSPEAGVSPLQDMSLEAPGGSLLVVHPEPYVETASLADVAQGLLAPERGSVCCEGRDWRTMGLFEAAARRGRIGRVYEHRAWVSNLDMFENLALAPRHHTDRSDAELRAEVDRLCGEAALPPDIRARRPHLLSRAESRRAQWVRAFVGAPVLVLLEAPLQEAGPHGDILGAWVQAARARGAAVLWIVSQAAEGEAAVLPGDARHLAVRGGRLLPWDSKETGHD